MNTCTMKLEATAIRPKDDDSLENLSASISFPVEDDDEVIGNTLCNHDLDAHVIGSLHALVARMRPEWMDNEETSLTIDAFLDGAKCQSRNGVVMMKPKSYTFDIE